MIRSLERIAYAVFCGALAFFVAGGLFTLCQWLLHRDVLAVSSLTLFYFLSMLAALAGGLAIGVLGYSRCADRDARIPRLAYLPALVSGPLFSLLVRLGFEVMPDPPTLPHMLHKPETLSEYWSWLSQLSAYHPPPQGRAWAMALVLSAAFAVLLLAQPYLVRRTCTRPHEGKPS